MKNRPKKKKQTSVHVAVLVGVVIIVLSVFFVYSNDQAKIRGEAFSKAIEFVQEDLRKTYHSFDSKVSMFNQSNITKDDFLKFAEKHELEMEKIIVRYSNLQPPQQFAPAVKLFKLSAETQFDADKYIIEWIRTGDDTARIRSVSSYEQSLRYEQAGLFEFNLVQRQANP